MKGITRWGVILRLLGDRNFDLSGYTIDCVIYLTMGVYPKVSGTVKHWKRNVKKRSDAIRDRKRVVIIRKVGRKS
jgi:hypothetical protein